MSAIVDNPQRPNSATYPIVMPSPNSRKENGVSKVRINECYHR